MCILLKLDYARFGVFNLFFSKVIEEKPLGGRFDPLVKDWANPISTGGVFHSRVLLFACNFLFLSQFPPNLVTFPKILYRIWRKIKIFGI